MLLIVDNNDSFTYNVVELIRKVSKIDVIVKKSDTLTLEEVNSFTHIIFSPGPSLPDQFPIMKKILEHFQDHKKILGICLGHQAICEFFGAQLYHTGTVKHGVSSLINCVPTSTLFRDKTELMVGRYHSRAAKEIPTCLKVTASDNEGVVMAVEHTSKNIYGVQFHPESYITQAGASIIENFLNKTQK
jgi:anthranilate synthase/aminodeoxychorismate synthase-like glutamine amidotransferase